MRQRLFAGHGFDSAHAGGNCRFMDNLQQADIAGAPDVRAAAKFHAHLTHFNDAHRLTVLFIKHCRRASL